MKTTLGITCCSGDRTDTPLLVAKNFIINSISVWGTKRPSWPQNNTSYSGNILNDHIPKLISLLTLSDLDLSTMYNAPVPTILF